MVILWALLCIVSAAFFAAAIEDIRSSGPISENRSSATFIVTLMGGLTLLFLSLALNQVF